ncbi:beta-N-acetylglucosaminidase domain-containing protein [Phenylobacterium sp.]|jgi:hyaluronoglucosaminidase|uniref:beta-N-acetylglucosaminidase domain-containing protein n=1 Tax=Phenylobacterium sp. TaxID=1871053 RepID=UPI003782FC42
MPTEIGVIEGFFGRPWTWAERTETLRFLGGRGYGFWLYAPKADPYLRRRWREPYPEAELAELRAFAACCRDADVRFGVGLTPFELHFGFDQMAKAALSAKLAALDDAGVQDLAILFDDMKGDVPDLAARQAEIVHWVGPRTKASRLIMCPSYYSDDPVLDRVFGARPAGYLDDLGRTLDAAVHVMWTGEEVCSREQSVGHLERVGQALRRRPFLWDNYPVNDGPRMSQHLHLRAFTGRPAAIAGHIAAHAVNPASQPVLSRIPMLTLVEAYARGEGYQYLAAFRRAASEVLGEALAARVEADLLSLEDAGLARLGERQATLAARYAAFDHPAAREIVDWLEGGYAITGEALQTQ